MNPLTPQIATILGVVMLGMRRRGSRSIPVQMEKQRSNPLVDDWEVSMTWKIKWGAAYKSWVDSFEYVFGDHHYPGRDDDGFGSSQIIEENIAVTIAENHTYPEWTVVESSAVLNSFDDRYVSTYYHVLQQASIKDAEEVFEQHMEKLDDAKTVDPAYFAQWIPLLLADIEEDGVPDKITGRFGEDFKQPFTEHLLANYDQGTRISELEDDWDLPEETMYTRVLDRYSPSETIKESIVAAIQNGYIETIEDIDNEPTDGIVEIEVAFTSVNFAMITRDRFEEAMANWAENMWHERGGPQVDTLHPPTFVYHGKTDHPGTFPPISERRHRARTR